MRWFARLAVVALLGAGLVACSGDRPACAAATPTPYPALRTQPVPDVAGYTSRPQPKWTYKPPSTVRTRSRVQDTTRPAPAAPKTTKPTSWKAYTPPPRNWSQPYGKGRPVAPQPTVTYWHNAYYRTYPGYAGYYPPGVWPVGYGDTYGCQPIEEGAPAS